jgi:hypothetical protein
MDHGSLLEHDIGPITDDELAALALAADPDQVLSADAISIWDLGLDDTTVGAGGGSVLPAWYMPAPMGAGPSGRRWLRRAIAITVIVAFLVIDAYGLCSTYGQIVVA